MLQSAHVRRFDVLAIGEVLVDFISDSEQVSLSESRHFTVFPGGAVANVSTNVTRLGGSALLVARVGEDYAARFLKWGAECDIDNGLKRRFTCE